MSQLLLAKKIMDDPNLKSMLAKFETDAAKNPSEDSTAITKLAEDKMEELRAQSK